MPRSSEGFGERGKARTVPPVGLVHRRPDPDDIASRDNRLGIDCANEGQACNSHSGKLLRHGARGDLRIACATIGLGRCIASFGSDLVRGLTPQSSV